MASRHGYLRGRQMDERLDAEKTMCKQGTDLIPSLEQMFLELELWLENG